MPKKEESVNKQPDSALSIVSLVLGVVSLTGPGLLLGIPAIVTAAIALKKNLGGRGLSIAGLVTGIVSTVLSLLFIMFIVAMVFWGLSHPQEFDDYPRDYPRSDHTEQLFDSSRT